MARIRNDLKSVPKESYVRDVRKLLKMSQQEYADLFGMSKTTISKIENDKQSVGPLFMGITRSLEKLDHANRESLINWIQGNITTKMSTETKMKEETNKTINSNEGIFKSIHYLDGKIEQFANDDTFTGNKKNDDIWKEYTVLKENFNKNNEWEETIEVKNSLFAIHSVLVARKTL